MGQRLTEPDLRALTFIAEHRLLLPGHVAVLLDVSVTAATARLRKLAEARYLRKECVFGDRPHYQITRRGLVAIGSSLPTPRGDLRVYEHDIGVAWLWLAARAGTFGPLEALVGERRLRSYDGAREPESEPLGVRLGGMGPRGRERLHYPDLLLRTADGRRIALELELTPKSRTRLEAILAGYGSEPRIAGVVYLVERPAIARSVETGARRVGVSDLVHVQRVRSSISAPAARTLGVERALEAGR
ncbi:MAG TPA: hypothetical protein VEF89_18385 [Solirubrobacteraceae bacterium]|nr:hypothetical protein [Solirubrobacteraceae bacterium]